MLEIFAITLLALAFLQTFPIDLAFLFAGDILVYLEIATLAALVAANARVRALLRYVAQSSNNRMAFRARFAPATN